MKLNFLITTDASEYSDKVAARLRAAGLDFFCSTASGPVEFQGLAGAPAPDLILLDYGLKSRDGEAALKAAGDTFPKTPCVVIADGFKEKELEKLYKSRAAS